MSYGNVEKLREALKECREYILVTTSDDNVIFDMIDAALAEPPRNCDLPDVRKEDMVGNAAAMREALVRIGKTAQAARTCNANEDVLRDVYLEDIIKLCATVLAAPPRNCDLPDPEDRFSKFCMSRSCESCPFQKSVCCRCKWLMAPESEVANDDQ